MKMQEQHQVRLSRPMDAFVLSPQPSWTAAVRRELARIGASLGVFEQVALAYLAFSTAMITVFSRQLSHFWKLIGTQAIVATIIFLLCAAGIRSEQRALHVGATFSTHFWRFWRHWYPHLFFLFCFEELAYLVHLVDPNWQDAKLIAFDHWVFGVHPSVWLEQFATPLRNDLFQLAYLTYFIYLLVLGGILYYRREWHAYWSVMTYSAVGYAIGYVIAILFPIQSPWFAMAGIWQGQLHGGPCTATINFIEHYGRVRGAAFPSEHVAGSVAVVWGAWRHRRWLFWVILPLVTAMCVSTIWGRYHYVADIFGGIITGTLGYFIGSYLMKRRARPAPAEL
ncbi:MAG TPA: phosphatase PAP2 family protein [Candidatus Eisenbacteria bacterium]|jgi:membrane-associated phospholipid phosphatase|nr:phosphatase PAP2 family protein [Candidatus Eisenbacteria bacterium]